MYNVLLIDKSKVIFEMLAKSESPTISELFYADTLDDVKEVVRTEKLDLIISDISLNGVDLFPLLHQLKSIAGKYIPIMILTSNSSRDEVIKAAAIGAAGYFLKPIEENVLYDKIKSCIKTAVDSVHHRNQIFVRPLEKDVAEVKFRDPVNGQLAMGTLLDISLCGMSFLQSADRHTKNVRLEDIIPVTLRLNEHLFNLICKISNVDKLLVAVEFNELSRSYRDILSKYIALRANSTKPV